MANKTFNTRVKNKRDTAANWEKVATTFQPLDGELIIIDTAAGKTRFKVGRYDSSKGRLLYYNEIPFADEYLYNDLNESQGKIYDTLNGIDARTIIESTLEPVAGADDKLYVYNIGLWQFPKTGFYKIKLAKVGALGVLLKLYARITKDDGTTPDDWDNDNLKAMGNASDDGLIEEIYAQVDYINDDKFTVYRVQFFNCFGYLGSFWVNTYDKTTQKWAYDYRNRVTADHVSNALTLTKGDTTTKFDGSTAQTVSIPTKTSELTNDSFVSYAEQTLTEDQQNQAKTNLGIDVLTGNTTAITPTQVKEAILAGRSVAITYTDTTYGNLTFTSFGYSLENNVVVANLVATSNGQYILADLTGIADTNNWTLQTTELGTSTDIANNYVKYSESQTLTDEQKATARTNIDAISSSEVSSNYLSLDDTQELTEIQKDVLRSKLNYLKEVRVASNWKKITAEERNEFNNSSLTIIQGPEHDETDNIPDDLNYPILLVPHRVEQTSLVYYALTAHGDSYICSLSYPSFSFSVRKLEMNQQTMKADPTEDMQIATKKYVDSAVGSTKFDIVLTLDTSKNKYVPTQTWDEIKAALEKSTDVKDYNLIVDGVYWSIECFVPDIITSSILGLYLQARNTYNYKTTTNPNNDEIVTLYKVTTIDYDIGQNINKVTSIDGAVTPYVENYVNILKDDTGAFSCYPIHAIEYMFQRNLNTIPTLLYDTVYSFDGIEMTNNSISVAYFSAVSNSIYRRFKITKSTNDAADAVTIDKEIILLDKSDVLTKTNTIAFTPTADYQPATKKYVDNSSVQSDWNQNDTTAKDYIKNRICYEEETVTELGNTYAIWHSLVADSDDASAMPGYKTIPISFKIEGKLCTNLTGLNLGSDDVIAYGDGNGNNLMIYPSNSEFTGTKGNVYAYVYKNKDEGSVPTTDFQFVKVENTVKQIDKKFIPIDDALDKNSENPVQNKVINAALAQQVNFRDSNYVSSTLDQSDMFTDDQKQIARNNIGALGKADLDTTLSSTSENAVQNKVVKAAIEEVQSAIDSKADTTALTQVTNDVAANYVKFAAEQTLTDEQKAQARENIGAVGESDITIFPVKISALQGGGMSNKTAKEIYDAHSAGKIVIATAANGSQYSLSIASMSSSKYQICFSAVKYDSSSTQTYLEFYYLKDASESSTARYTFYTYNFDDQYVKFTAEQTLTDDQKAQARENINAPSPADAVYTVTASSTDGVAYTATVSGIDSLTVGASFIMIPNKASTSKAPTLDVNGLGAKPIRRRLSSLTTSLQQGYSTNWIALNKPFTVVYDGTAWIVEGLTKTDGADVYGAVAQATADANGNNIADTYATIAMLQSLLPKVTTITLTTNWTGSASPYYQDIALSCVTETSIVDLQPTPEQLASWQDEGLAFTTLSGNGTVRVYAAGGKPSSAITVQVRVQEVTVI